ncbi:hypothetical protein Aperf_G00000116576 [Anoplocephala perfoliata]
MSFSSVTSLWQIWRNFLAFWCFGIFNNFIYVIMLSAAVDILEKSHPRAAKPPDLPTGLQYRGRINCTEMGTGAILLADIAPSLSLKIIAPLFIRRLRFPLKIFLCVVFAISAFLIVSSSKSIGLSLFGVVCASISCGLGDVTFLTMMAFFEPGIVSAWSSGTGAAGVVGALSYAAMTSIWSPVVVLRVAMFAPLTLLFLYFVVLKKPQHSVFQVSNSSLHRHAQIVGYSNSTDSGAPTSESVGEEEEEALNDEEPLFADEAISDRPLLGEDFIPSTQISPSWEAKKRIFMDIFPLIFSLALVYFFEYLINQALFELVYFENGMTQAQQYRWFQVTYQCGVFASRSSLKLFKVRRTWILAILQGLNFILFLIQVLRPYIVSIFAFFSLIAFEGILGGISYVNTFHRVLTVSDLNTREYTMSIAALSDSFGITGAAFAAIPLHNWLCKTINS